VWNQFTIRVRDGRRDTLQQELAERKIGSAVYYPVPLHLQKCFAKLGYQPGSLPETEQATVDVLSLPVYAEMTTAEQDVVIGAIAEFCGASTACRPKTKAA
jgi:dTDP-4-amino-4,6-dideoxygalactose transaminase